MGLTAATPGIAAAAALVVAALALAVVFRWRDRLPHAVPNARSLHDGPMLRVGGISIWAGFFPVAAAMPGAIPGGGVTLAAVAALAGMSLVDDWRGVHAKTRLALQLALATVVAAMLLWPQRAALPPALPLAAAIAIAALALAWAANLFNFMDGSDGLAAAMAVLGFGAYGAAAGFAGAPSAAYWALAAATIPLFVLNLPPARTFMGDVGSVPLGFLAAAVGLAGWRAGTWPGWLPLLVFLPFVADASVTLAQRLLRGERVWEAHRAHYYQRLHQLGAGHRGTLLFFGVLMTGTAASALLTLAFGPAAGWWVLGGWCAAFSLLFAGIDYHWNRRNPDPR
ncbi:MAG: hypothetical protein ABI886_01935 [Betaproteobacteria bacterium]